MTSRTTLQVNFFELFSTFIRKNVTFCCTQGRMACSGTLLKVSKNSIMILEKDKNITIPLKHIFTLNPSTDDNIPPESVFEQPNSELFQQYKQYLNQTIHILGKTDNIWAEKGKIKYIGNDYFVVLNDYDKELDYLYVAEGIQINPF